MKKLILLFALSFLIFNLNAQTGWHWQNPDPQGNRLNGVSVIGTHWAVGDLGTVIHRVIPGAYWEVVDIGTTENLNDVDIFSISQQGWIVGDNGTIFYTEDNGQTWVLQNSGTTKNLHAVSAVNDACVWVCGEDGTVLRSLYDGGEWENVSPNTQLTLYGIDAYHCNEAWIVGEDGLIMNTENGGQLWNYHNSGTGNDLMFVDMSENGTSRACGHYEVIISKEWDTDTWVQENISADYYWLNSIETSIGQSGYAVGYNGLVLKGTGGGDTWIQQDTDIPWELNDIKKISLEDDTYQVVGQYGIMMKNSGFNTDFEVTNDLFWHFLFDIEFINADTGWAAGGAPGWTGQTDGAILKTTDGGQTWNVMREFQTPVLDMDFVNENEGWIIGRDGFIRHTANGGANWGTQTGPISSTFTSVSFADENNGWIVTSSNWGEIIHTSNGGNTWTIQSNPSNKPLHDVYFIDANTGWATGLEAALIKTTDGGTTWQQIDVNAAQNYRFASVYFVDHMHGWLSGIYGSLMRTTDGGNTWTKVESGTNQSIEDIFFVNADVGWAVGDQGTILHSTDGGQTWYEQVSGVATNFITGVYFIDETRGWVSGEGGTILYTITGGSNQTNTIHVDIENNTGNEDGSFLHPWNTVAEGLEAAIAGDSVIIHPGVYEEAPLSMLPIKDGVIVVGVDSASTFIQVPFESQEPALMYYTEISGLSCPGYAVANGEGSATLVISGCHLGDISLSSAGGYTFIIEECTIDGFITNTSGANLLTIANNHFTGGGIIDNGAAPEGFEAHIVHGNTFTGYMGSKDGIAVISSNGTSFTFSDNTINVSGADYGLSLKSGWPTNVTDNTITLDGGDPVAGTTGIHTMAGQGVVTGNIISGVDTAYFSQSAASLFENNVITNCNTGLVSNGAERVNNNHISGCAGNGLVSLGLAGPVQNNTIINNDSAGIVLYAPADLGGGNQSGEGRNTLQYNGYVDLWVKYFSLEPDTVFARYNLWDHNTVDEILANDVMIEPGSNVYVRVDDFLVLPGIPSLISPENNATNVQPLVTFTWNLTAVSDRYHLQLSTDHLFGELVADTAGLNELSYQMNLQPQTTYYWHVRATNPAGDGEWSETWNFTTGPSGIHENPDTNVIELYPNPAAKNITVKSTLFVTGNAVLELFSPEGKKLVHMTIPAGNETMELNTSELKNGMYVCRITTEENIVSMKLIIQK